MSRSAARLLACALALLPFATMAQQEPLYRVELLVFNTPAGGTAEQWDATPELSYPGRTQFLSSGEGRGEPAPEDAAAGLLAAPAQASAYVPLPSAQRELGARAAAMQRSGRYRILFHEAWNQPMASKPAAVPIVLDHSGDGGPWPALQGTIKLYLSRYFYLDTNLWLNTQGEYLPGTWRMPPPPRAPAAQPAELPGALESSLTGDMAAASSLDQLVDNTPVTASASPVYPYRHAVLLKQSRRMRSGQLNYIDHPMLGILVKVTPLKAPETDATGSS